MLEKIFRLVLFIISLISIFMVFAIFLFFFLEIKSLFFNDNFEIGKLFFKQEDQKHLWNPTGNPMQYNVVPLIIGSLKITLIALLFAIPLAFFASIFTSQFVSRRVRFYIKGFFEFLANIPSVVLGFLGFLLFSNLISFFFNFQFRLNSLLAGLTLGLGIFPIIYTIYEDFLWNIPKSYKEASLSLGATVNQTILYVFFPYSIPSFFVAIILGFNRAIGETMIVLMLSGNTPLSSWDFSLPARALSATIATEVGETIFGEFHYSMLFLLGFFLLSFTFLVNMFVYFFMKNWKKNFLIGITK